MNKNSEHWFSRTLMITGDAGYERLQSSHVLIAGLGGVGAYAAEQLARAGVGRLTIIDGDTVHLTNLNRQLLAVHSTLHKPKAELMAERLRDINPEIQLDVIQEYVKDQRVIDLLSQPIDFVIDAIDTLSPKAYLIYHALRLGHSLVSSMGAGGKFDPNQVKLVDIEETYNCQLAQALRKKLHKLGVKSGFQAVFSPEPVPKSAFIEVEGERNKKSTVGTISFMPAIFGCFCAAAAINYLLTKQ